MGGDGGVIAAKREYMQSCGDVFGMKGGMAKTALNRTETAELRTKVSREVAHPRPCGDQSKSVTDRNTQ